MESLREMQAVISQEPAEKLPIGDRLDALVKVLAPSDNANVPTKDHDVLANPQEGNTLAAELFALVDVATKIVQLDTLAAKAAEAETANTEAKMWQEVSLNTLQWSRAALVEQQQRCAGRLGNRVLGAAALPTLPVPSSTPAPLVAAPTLPAQPCQPNTQQPLAMDGMNSADDGKTWTGTLRKHLEDLQEKNPKSIIIVRRINRLGFQSSTCLEQYFSQFGAGVLDVLVAHSRVKPSVKRPVARVRPAGIGFVVMANPEDVDAILEAEHEINGVSIQVQRYETRLDDENAECDEEHGNADQA